MKLSIRKTKEDFKHHLQYSSWVYVLLIVLSFVVVSLVYAQTAYRPPQDKRIDVYIQSSNLSAEQAKAYLEPIRVSAVPEMEAVETVMMLPPAGEHDYYANIQLVTYLAAGDGDLYLLNAADFKRLASQGAFMPLDMLLPEEILRSQRLDLTTGKVQLVESKPDGSLMASGEPQLFGIPLTGLDSLAAGLGVNANQTVVSVAVNGGNADNSMLFLKALVAQAADTTHQ